MNRFFFLTVLILSVCVMSACAPPEPKLNDAFDIPLSVGGTIDCAAGLCRTDDSLTLTLTSPESLAGVSYTFSGGELTTSYNGLSCITDDAALPDTALPNILYTVVKNIKNAAYLRSDEDGDVFQLQGATVTIGDGIPVRIDVTNPAYSILSS